MATDLDAAFTPESARELYDHLANSWPRDRALATRMLNLYWDEQAVTLPATGDVDRNMRYQPERATTQEGRRIIDLLASLYTEPAAASLAHRDEGVGRADEREKVEQALVAARRQVDRRNRVRMARVYGQLITGRGAQLGPMAGGEHWWNYPYREADESLDHWKERRGKWEGSAPGLPFVYIELPPETTFPASLGYQDDLVGTTLELTYFDLCAMFSQEELVKALPNRDPAKAKPTDTFTLFMASNRTHLTYTLIGKKGVSVGPLQFGSVGDAELRQIQHDMGRSVIRVPPGITRSRWPGEVGYYWVPAVQAVVELIQVADRAASMLATGAKMGALPILKAKVREMMVDSEGTGQKNQPRFLGDIWQIDPGDASAGVGAEDIEALHLPEFGEHMQALLQFALGRAERMTGSGAMLEGLMTADTAWATKTALDYAIRKQAELTRAIADADRDDYEGYLLAAKAYGDPITIRKGSGEGGALTLSPEAAERWMMDLESDYRPEVPVNKVALWQAAVELMQRSQAAKLPLPFDAIMEEFQITDQPWEFWKRSVTWDAMTSPFIRERLLRKRLDEADAEVDAEDESMTMDEANQRAQRMSPAQQQRAAFALNSVGQRAAAGMQREGTPFGTQQPEIQGVEATV